MISDSVTKCSPLYKNGQYVYDITSLDTEVVICSHCSRYMHFRNTRLRMIKNATGEEDCAVVVPKYRCKCGSIRTMHPYFLAKRKKYSLVAIQEIVTADAYKKVWNRNTIKTDTTNARNSRRWIIKFLWSMRTEVPQIDWPSIMMDMTESPIEREQQRFVIRKFYEMYGENWLINIVQRCNYSESTDLSPLYSVF